MSVAAFHAGVVDIPLFVMKRGMIAPAIRQWLGDPDGISDVFGIFDVMHECPQWHERYRFGSRPLGKDKLAQPNERGKSYLDNPHSWEEFSTLVRDLREEGEFLGKADLLQTNPEGRTWLEQAARSGQFDTVVRYLAAQGEFLEKEDLLDAAGKANATLKAAVAWGQHSVLFQFDHWKDRPMAGALKIYHALPEAAQDQITQRSAFFEALKRTERQRRVAEQRGIRPPDPETLSAEAQQVLNRALFDAVKKGEINEAQDWFDLGASPNWAHDGETPLHVAAENRDVPMMRLLAAHGMNLDMKAPSDDLTVLHRVTSKIHSLELAEEVLALGASPFMRAGEKGLKPREMVAGLSQPPIGMLALLKRYENLPVIRVESLPVRSELEARNAHGLSYLDHPAFWEKLPEVNAALQARGEATFDKDWVLGDAEHTRGVSRLMRALKNTREHSPSDAVLTGALAALGEQGQALDVDALVAPDGTPTELLGGIVREGAAPALFDEALWLGHKSHELKRLYRATQHVAPVEISNIHVLQARVSQFERSHQREAALGGMGA